MVLLTSENRLLECTHYTFAVTHLNKSNRYRITAYSPAAFPSSIEIIQEFDTESEAVAFLTALGRRCYDRTMYTVGDIVAASKEFIENEEDLISE